MCQPHRMYGYFKDYCGGMAEYVRIPTQHAQISRVPEELPLESAVLSSPMVAPNTAVDRAEITPEDIVVLSGAGTLGLGMTTCARLCHPKQLIVLDMKEDRLAKAKKFGAGPGLESRKDGRGEGHHGPD